MVDRPSGAQRNYAKRNFKLVIDDRPYALTEIAAANFANEAKGDIEICVIRVIRG